MYEYDYYRNFRASDDHYNQNQKQKSEKIVEVVSPQRTHYVNKLNENRSFLFKILYNYTWIDGTAFNANNLRYTKYILNIFFKKLLMKKR